MAINISVKGYHVPNTDYDTVKEYDVPNTDYYATVDITFIQTIRQFRNLGGLELIPVSEFSSAPEQQISVYIGSKTLRDPILSRNHICKVVSNDLKQMLPTAIDRLADKVLSTIESLAATTTTTMTVTDELVTEGFDVEAEVEVVTEDVANYMLTMDDIFNNNIDDQSDDKLKAVAELNCDYGGRCGICLKEYFTTNETELIRRLPCLHVYHHDCVVSWWEKHNNCPLCRVSTHQLSNSY